MVEQIIVWDCGDQDCPLHATREEAMECAASKVQGKIRYVCPICGDTEWSERRAMEHCDVEYCRAQVEESIRLDHWAKSRRIEALKKCEERVAAYNKRKQEEQHD